MKKRFLLAAAVTLCMPGVVLGYVPWSPASGTAQTGNYSWSDGYNDTGNFGDPTNVGDALFFNSANFDCTANDGNWPAGESKDDTMNVDFTALNNQEFASIAVYAYGNYTITDGGGTDNAVTANFDITATGTGPTAGHPDSPWGPEAYSYFQDSEGAGSWGGNAQLLFDYTVPPDITNLHLEVGGETIAVSDGQGGTASIQATVALLQVAVTVIPEPASLSLLALGGLAVLRRRR